MSFKLDKIRNLNHLKEEDLEEIIKQSLISQMENFHADEDDLETMNQNYKQDPIVGQLNEDERGVLKEHEQMEKLDAIESKLNKIKNDNAKLLDKKKKPKDKNHRDDSSSSDENEN